MSTKSLAPYINFQGRAREAMTFYHGVFGGELELYASDDKGQPRPAAEGERIMFAQLETDDFVIVASDGRPDHPAQAGDHIGLSLRGSDKAAMTKAFKGLAEGGKVAMPLREMPWGTSGWLADRFGINWNFDISQG